MDDKLWIGKVIIFLVMAYGFVWEKTWAFRRLVRLDKWVNRNLLNGWKGETISRRGGRVLARRAVGNTERGDFVWCILCRLLDVVDKNHCANAYAQWQEDNASKTETP